jgi:transcriptional regulator
MGEADARAFLVAFDRASLLVTASLSAVHLPLFLDGDRLVGHVARANDDVWRAAPCEALVVMAGPEAYVSPNWYPSKAEHGRAVPTWNYVTLHVRGQLTTFDDRARLEGLVARLSAQHEAREAKPWTLDEAPRDYIERLLGAIVGVELAITHIDGKRKLGQDKPEADRNGVAEALMRSADARDVALARAMHAEP